RDGARVEMRDRPDAALAFELTAVKSFDRQAQRGDRTHAGDDYTSSHDSLPLPVDPRRGSERGAALRYRLAAKRSVPFLAYHGSALTQVGVTDFHDIRLRRRARPALNIHRAGRIALVVIECRRQHAVLQREQAGG